VSQSTVSRLERGAGGSLTVDVWQRAFVALDRRLLVEASRDPRADPADAGHLAIQELVLRLARANGVRGTFELPVPSATGRHSIDVFERDDRARRLVVIECLNVIRDIGAAARSFAWKLAKAEDVAVAIGGEAPYRVHGCWVVRATHRNRALVRRFPEVFASRFPGSSARWANALTRGAQPPDQPGLVWASVDRTRLVPWRTRSRPSGR
jgi:hypothetical protein